MKRIALIDGNSLINRAYYAMRNPMITKEGIYTHAIFGFINMLDKIRADYDPEYMAIAFDMKGPTFRHDEYEEYKAGRKKMPPELAMQIPLMKDILDAMRIKRLELEGFEADDIIGTMARSAESDGMETYIFTGDKDQLQLATDATKIIYTKRGVTDFDLFDHDSFVEEYGFTPLQFIDFKGLSGDPSDNIPGIPGVGAKTATNLIKDYGSVEEIIARADEIRPAGLQKKVSENVQQALLSKRLATINVNVPLDIAPAECILTEPDYESLIALYKKLEFNRFLSRLKVSGDAAVSDTDTSDEGSFEIKKTGDFTLVTVSDDSELSDLAIDGECVIKVFGDNNHLSDPVLQGITLLNGNTCYYFNLQSMDESGGFYKWLDKQNISFMGHDMKRDYFMLMSKGCERDFETAFDTAVAQYVLDSGRSNYKLSALSNEYFHETVEEEEDFLASNGQMDMFTDSAEMYSAYGLKVCVAVLNLATIQKQSIVKEDLERVLYDVELPLIQVMAGMEKEGFRADKQYLSQFGDVLAGEVEALSDSIQEIAGTEFNVNSTAQLGEILFEKMDLPHGKKTKRGYSTSAEVLEKIIDRHPIIPAILEYRTLSKLKSTYIDGMIPLINTDDGKIHAHFRQTVTTTGRISCTEPNLQNIPVRQELGRKLRKAFIPECEECVLLSADYSQIELRVLAHMSGDESLIKAFNEGEDIHRATAANVLGIPEGQITIEERSRAKAVNFGVIYGMSAFGLSGELNITRKEADDYIKAYFTRHTAVKTFMDNSVAFAKENGYVTTLMGRKRHIKELKATQFVVRQMGERLAMNTPIQGSAADIIKLAMIRVYSALKKQNLKSKLILQIHDELIVNVYPDELKKVEELLAANMEAAYELAVELKAELNTGKNWYDLK
ncbi:MAG: DNA polymerase I [Lentihominibacter sp.]|jgi:DNA polymerase-1